MQRLVRFALGALVLELVATLLVAACYSLRDSRGGGEAEFSGAREPDAADVAVPDGYRIELVAQGLTFPTGICFGPAGAPCVVESGYSYGEVWNTPRLLRIEDGSEVTVLAEGGRNGPWNGVEFDGGAFFVAEGGALEGGRILRVGEDGTKNVLVEGLPSFGDHHTNGPVVRDGWVYFGQGTATNSGVVGEDSAQFGWLRRQRGFHDVPGADIELRGQTFESPDVLRPEREERAKTGAFAPFGESGAREVRGATLCNGAILRVRVEGGEPELVAWGFRNPFGLAFAPDGTLYATDNGYDERGSRPVWGAADFLWRVEQGAWYGWPDFSGDRLLSEDEFRPPNGKRLEPLLARHPGKPPAPIAALGVHSSADGFDFSRSERFGHVGDAFIALFGDQTPATGKTLAPVGFRVVRVEVETGVVHNFALNRESGNGPASRIGGQGLERPIAARFDREGEALYVVDFGVLLMDEKGSHPRQGTGAVWRIVREGAP